MWFIFIPSTQSQDKYIRNNPFLLLANLKDIDDQLYMRMYSTTYASVDIYAPMIHVHACFTDVYYIKSSNVENIK